MCQRRNLYLFGFFQVSWIKWHPAQVAVSWGQAWEQGNFLHPHSRKSPRRWERVSKSPREGSFLLSWGGAQLPPFPPGASFISHSPEQNSALCCWEFMKQKSYSIQIVNRQSSFPPRLQLGKHYDREKKLMFAVCFAGLFLICPETTTQPSLWHWTELMDGGGMAWGTCHRSLGNPVAHCHQGQEYIGC